MMIALRKMYSRFDVTIKVTSLSETFFHSNTKVFFISNSIVIFEKDTYNRKIAYYPHEAELRYTTASNCNTYGV